MFENLPLNFQNPSPGFQNPGGIYVENTPMDFAEYHPGLSKIPPWIFENLQNPGGDFKVQGGFYKIQGWIFKIHPWIL